jgi:hypothetical protein
MSPKITSVTYEKELCQIRKRYREKGIELSNQLQIVKAEMDLLLEKYNINGLRKDLRAIERLFSKKLDDMEKRYGTLEDFDHKKRLIG